MADSTQILDLARAHFDKQRGQEIEIPEWGVDGEPLICKFDPPTLRTRQTIQSRAGKSDARQMALTVQLCLRENTDTAALIFKDDAVTLATLEAQVDPKVMARIAQKILGLSADDSLGN